MLKTLKSFESTTQLGKSAVGIGGDSKAKCDGKCKFNGNKIGGGEVDGSEGRYNKDDKVKKKGQKTSKSKNLSKSKKTVGSSDFLIHEARLGFTELRQASVKAPILHHFDPKRHIQIETDVLGYAIGEVLS